MQIDDLQSAIDWQRRSCEQRRSQRHPPSGEYQVAKKRRGARQSNSSLLPPPSGSGEGDPRLKASASSVAALASSVALMSRKTSTETRTACSVACSGGAAARTFPGALKRGLGRGPDGPRLVFKDVPAQRRSQATSPEPRVSCCEKQCAPASTGRGGVWGIRASKLQRHPWLSCRGKRVRKLGRRAP